MAAGHALDNISDWLEKSAPMPPLDKPKLNRAASLTPVMAAKFEENVNLFLAFISISAIFNFLVINVIVQGR